MALTLDGDGITVANLTSAAKAELKSGRKNLLINGAMQVAQRGTSTSEINDYGSVDRFKTNRSGYDNLLGTQAQVSDAPEGFGSSYKFTSTTEEAASDAGNIFRVFQAIEGQNLQQLKYGTANAETLTLSFWVKSNVTGTYAFSIYADASGGSRAWGTTYSISASNTWEKKTITIPGDTVRAIDNDNGENLRMQWILGVGSTYTSTDNTSWGAYSSGKVGYGHTATLDTTAGATWQLTGVQLEVGDTATDFEHRSYGEELALCQRYYYKQQSSFSADSTTSFLFNFQFPVTMRTSPSVSYSWGGVDGDFYKNSDATTPSFASPNGLFKNANGITTGYKFGTSFTKGDTYTTQWELDAEL